MCNHLILTLALLCVLAFLLNGSASAADSPKPLVGVYVSQVDVASANGSASAYAITGDKRYAHKAAVILDALATVQPTTIGPRDFAPNAESLQGRFHQLTSIVFRTKVHQVNAYDLIGRLDELDVPSPTNPGLTMRENITRKLLEDYLFLHFDVRGGKLGTLHNHEADCVRGMLAVGMVTGNPDCIRWGLDAISHYISNTIDRAVDQPAGWKAGDDFEPLDFAPGDQITIPLSAQSTERSTE